MQPASCVDDCATMFCLLAAVHRILSNHICRTRAATGSSLLDVAPHCALANAARCTGMRGWHENYGEWGHSTWMRACARTRPRLLISSTACCCRFRYTASSSSGSCTCVFEAHSDVEAYVLNVNLF